LDLPEKILAKYIQTNKMPENILAKMENARKISGTAFPYQIRVRQFAHIYPLETEELHIHLIPDKLLLISVPYIVPHY